MTDAKTTKQQIGYVKTKSEANTKEPPKPASTPKQEQVAINPIEEKPKVSLSEWLKNHEFINKSALCKAAKVDRGNFDKYLKMGEFPEKTEQALSEQLKKYGYEGV